MTAPLDEAEVERLASVYDHAHDSACDRFVGRYSAEGVARAHMDGIRAALADLSSRWHLVPREGEERTEVDGPCGVCKGTGEVFDDKGWSPAFPGDRPRRGSGIYWCGFCDGTGGTKPARSRIVRTIPDGNGGTWVHTGPWEPVEEHLPCADCRSTERPCDCLAALEDGEQA